MKQTMKQWSEIEAELELLMQGRLRKVICGKPRKGGRYKVEVEACAGRFRYTRFTVSFSDGFMANPKQIGEPLFLEDIEQVHTALVAERMLGSSISKNDEAYECETYAE